MVTLLVLFAASATAAVMVLLLLLLELLHSISFRGSMKPMSTILFGIYSQSPNVTWIHRSRVCVFFIWNSQTMHAMCNNIASFNGISIGVVHAFRSIRMHLNTLSDAVFEHTTYAIINQITRHEFICKRFAMHTILLCCLKNVSNYQFWILLAWHLCWFDAFIMSYIRSLCEFVEYRVH